MFEASSVYMDSTQAKNLIDQCGDCNYDWNPQTEQAYVVQSSANRLLPGAYFVPASANHFCVTLTATFMQHGNINFAEQFRNGPEIMCNSRCGEHNTPFIIGSEIDVSCVLVLIQPAAWSKN